MPRDRTPGRPPMTLGKDAQSGIPPVLPAPPPPRSERCSQPGLTNPPQATASTPPSLSQQEHKGRRGLLIPSCSAFPAICASFGIGNNLPFAASQLAAGKQPMHPSRCTPASRARGPKRSHPGSACTPGIPRQNRLQAAPSHAPRVRPAGTAAGTGTQRTPRLPFPLPLPRLPSPTSPCLCRGTGGARGVPRGCPGVRVGLSQGCAASPARLCCSTPLGTSRGACANTLSPK